MANEGKRTNVFEELSLWIVVNVFLVLIVIGALVVAGIFGRQLVTDNQEDSAHEEAVTAARQLVVNFMTSSYQTVDADLARTESGTTGTFGEEWTKNKSALRETIVANQSTSVGKILSAAVVYDDPNYQTDADSAAIILAADANVSNVNAPDGRLVHYRVVVEMANIDGKWLIGKLEFIQ